HPGRRGPQLRAHRRAAEARGPGLQPCHGRVLRQGGRGERQAPAGRVPDTGIALGSAALRGIPAQAEARGARRPHPDARFAPAQHRRLREGRRVVAEVMLQSSLRFAPAKVNVEKRHDGSIVLRSPQKLGAYARCVTEWLVHWSDHSPERVFLAERSGDGWRRISYRESYGAVRRIGQALLNLGLNQERPVAILSDNSIDHALLMLGANQQMLAQAWPFVEDRPPVIVDWLPWNHTFGGNHNFNLLLRNGGTLYIDSGKPAPGLAEITARNLKEIAPTLYFNVPRGYDLLLPFLEKDAELRRNFFSQLDVLF